MIFQLLFCHLVLATEYLCFFIVTCRHMYFFQASCGAVESLMKLHNANLSPPQDCEWALSVHDLKSKYETSVGKKLMSEDTADRGKRRLQVALKSFKTHGAYFRFYNQLIILYYILCMTIYLFMYVNLV